MEKTGDSTKLEDTLSGFFEMKSYQGKTFLL